MSRKLGMQSCVCIVAAEVKGTFETAGDWDQVVTEHRDKRERQKLHTSCMQGRLVRHRGAHACMYVKPLQAENLMS